MKQSALSIQYTKLDLNSVIINQDGKYFAVPEARKDKKNNQTNNKTNSHTRAIEGETRETRNQI